MLEKNQRILLVFVHIVYNNIYYHPRLEIPRHCNAVIIICMKKIKKNIIKFEALSSLEYKLMLVS